MYRLVVPWQIECTHYTYSSESFGRQKYLTSVVPQCQKDNSIKRMITGRELSSFFIFAEGLNKKKKIETHHYFEIALSIILFFVQFSFSLVIFKSR